jgi:hypothetical protein
VFLGVTFTPLPAHVAHSSDIGASLSVCNVIVALYPLHIRGYRAPLWTYQSVAASLYRSNGGSFPRLSVKIHFPAAATPSQGVLNFGILADPLRFGFVRRLVRFDLAGRGSASRVSPVVGGRSCTLSLWLPVVKEQERRFAVVSSGPAVPVAPPVRFVQSTSLRHIVRYVGL